MRSSQVLKYNRRVKFNFNKILKHFIFRLTRILLTNTEFLNNNSKIVGIRYNLKIFFGLSDRHQQQHYNTSRQSEKVNKV